VSCGDKKVRKCIPIVSTWLADHMENVTIHRIKANRCPICMVTPSELGKVPKTPYGMRDHGQYERLFQAGDLDE